MNIEMYEIAPPLLKKVLVMYEISLQVFVLVYRYRYQYVLRIHPSYLLISVLLKNGKYSNAPSLQTFFVRLFI